MVLPTLPPLPIQLIKPPLKLRIGPLTWSITFFAQSKYCPFRSKTSPFSRAGSPLEPSADIAKVQEWFGHAKISTTRVYDRRKSEPEDPPVCNVKS
jgi:hypothetical protein